MTQTFNLNILNNSFNVGKNINMSQTMDRDPNTANISPRAVRSLAVESYAPFTVIPNAKIPDLSENRREERDERV